MANQYPPDCKRIAQQIAVDQRVYDVNRNEVGTVAAYDTTVGWVKVERGILMPTDFYIPFSAISDIDSQHIDLTLSSYALRHDFTTPPPRTTAIARGVDSATGAAKTTAITSEPSGYDGTPVMTTRTNVEHLGAQIAAGVHASAATGDSLRVYTVDGESVGSLKRYDPVSGWMLVEQGLLVHHDVYVPVTIVVSVNLDAGEVYLAVTKNDLQRLDATPPADVRFGSA